LGGRREKPCVHRDRDRRTLTRASQLARQAVIVGTDIPDLTAEVIDAAFRALDDHEVRSQAPGGGRTRRLGFRFG